MYVPEHFQQTNSDILIRLISDYSFGLLVTASNDDLVATHLPFLVEQPDEQIILTGHMARANPHWQLLGESRSMAVFQGPHAYISPTWYHSPSVPTWNYAAVHVYGTVSLVTEPETLHSIVQELSDKYERYRADPWIPDYDDRMLNAIVGFRMTVDDIQGKYKMSQNKSKADRHGVIDRLRQGNTEDEAAVADIMRDLEHG